MTTFRYMTVEHLGPDATEKDLKIFVALCRAVEALNPEWFHDDITDTVWGDGDYFRNARNLGVDVDSIVAEIDEDN